MDKNQLVEDIKLAASQNVLSKDEVISAYDLGVTKPDTQETFVTHHLSVAEVLYYIGGLVVIIGIIVLVVQHWGELNTFTRLLVTLGVGIVSYISSILLGRYPKLDSISQVFGLISAPTMTIGIKSLMDEQGIEYQTSAMLSLISGLTFTLYIVSYFIFRKFIFLLLTILLGTLLFFSFTDFLFERTSIDKTLELAEYRILIIGASYLLLGYYFNVIKQTALVGFLNGFGIIGFLGAALALGGWKPEQNAFWEIIFPGLAMGSIFLSVQFKASSYLVFGTLFLMAYILKITYEYLSDSLGWAFSLIIAGLALILIGYIAFEIHKKYMGKKA